MKLFIKLFKNSIKRTLSFIVLEIFILSFGILTINPDDNNKESSWIDLYYSYDRNNNILKLTWNNIKLPSNKYYVFKKGQYDIEYIMVSSIDGIDENYYITSLNDNLGANFVVCTTPEIKGFPDDISVVSVDKDNDDYVGKFKKLRNCIKTESNVVCIELHDVLNENLYKYAQNNEEDKNIIKKEEAAKIIKDKEMENNKKIIIEKKTVITKNDSNLEEKKYDIKKDLMFVLSSADNKNDDNKSKNKYRVEGLFKLNNDGETDIDYKGVKMKIPDGATDDDSFIYIKLLEKDELYSIPANAPNITNVDESNKYYGYDINLFVKKKRSNVSKDDIDEELNKKITLIMESSDDYVWVIENRFLKDIDLSLQYDGDNIPQYTSEGASFIYYYDESENKWINLARTSLDKTNNWIVCKTNHFCQFYTGSMTTPGEPPQAKGINTNPINIQKADPMIGIKGLPAINPNNKGTTQTSYPITVPEGINNLTPNVSIIYSNEIKEGNCGYGWNLGTSSIEIKTKNMGTPKYDGNDKLLLDGRELVKISSNEYRYKVEGLFSRIIKNKDNSFTVYQTDGSKLIYGENYGSRLYDPNDGARIFSWHLSKIIDKFNNTISYEYINTGNLYLSKISYGYNNYYTINFKWKDKDIIYNSYRSGFLITYNKILERIQIKYKSNLILKEYKLNTSYRSYKTFLDCIEETDGSNNILNKISLNYTEEKKGWIQTGYYPPVSFTDKSGKCDNGVRLVDVNGDGLDDILWYDKSSQCGIFLNTGNAWQIANYFPPVKFTDGSDNSGDNGVRLGDVNGDGLVDILYNDDSAKQMAVFINTGHGWIQTGYYPPVSFTDKDGKADNGVRLGDVNGDGLVDILWYDKSSQRGIFLNTGNGWQIADYFPPVKFTDGSDNSGDNGVRLGDVNGDGLIDILYNDDSAKQMAVFINTGHGWIQTGYYPPVSFTDKDGKKDNGVRLGDVNGDGLVDILWYDKSSQRGIFLNTGNGWQIADYFPPVKFTDGSDNSGDNGVRLGDVNGDGLIDILYSDDDYDQQGIWINQYKEIKLSKITNEITGLITTLEYQNFYYDINKENTGNYSSKNCLFSITIGNNDFNMTTYISYKNGVYDRIEKEFRGFSKVITTYTDKEKTYVSHTTETTYRNNDIDYYDSCNNPIYNKYLSGQVDSSIQKIKINDSTIILGKEKYEYEKNNVLTGNNNIKMVYPSIKRAWIYNDKGQFLGVDEVKGDIVSENNYTMDLNNGLITQTTQISYNDPNKNNDNIKTVTNYSIDVNKWQCHPINMEKIDVFNNTRISYKAIEYFENGSVLSESVWNNDPSNPKDPKTIFEYDKLGNVTKIIDDLTKLETNISIDYDKDNYYKIVIKTMPDGLKETTKTDQYGRVKETIDIYDDTIIFNYDNYSRVTSIEETIDGNIKVTKGFSYETIKVDGKKYFKVEAKYIDELTPKSPDGGYIRMQFIKDSFGRNVQTKKESMIDDNKCWTVSSYIVRDKMGRAIKAGVSTTADYANEGLIDNKDKSLKYPTDYKYDDFGRFYHIIMPNGYEIMKEYQTNKEENGIEIASIIKDNKNRMDTEYKDMLGNVIRAETTADDGHIIKTTFEYDLHGNAKLYEAIGAMGEKQFDSLGRLQWMRSPDAGKFELKYNALGQLETVIDYGRNENDGEKREVNYIYDNLSRIIKIDYTDTDDSDITYEYNGIDAGVPKYARSNIKSISKGSYYKVEYSFDQLGIEENKIIEGASYNTKYEYDVQGRINRLTYPDGDSIIYAYDEGGYLKSITDEETKYAYIESIKYNEYGQRTYVKYGNGTETKYTYDSNDNMIDTMNVNKDAIEFLNYDYDFDITGNLIQLKNGTTSTQTYTYDSLGRIAESKGDYNSGTSTYNETYTFDDNNRIITKHKDGTTYNFNYLPNTHAIDNIIITGNKTGDIKFNYDDFGNMLSKITTIGSVKDTMTFNYNEANQLVNMQLPGGYQLDFMYDNKGQRIKKTYKDNVGIIISKSVYVNGFYDLKDESINKHISDGQYIIASLIDNKLDNILYYTQNNIGSTSMLTDNKGNKVQSYLFTPYGEPWITENPMVDVERMFTGHTYDKESKLYYMNARYMDPEVGIFITPDPAMQGFNHYAYCSANPINYTDPTGMSDSSSWGLIDFIVGSCISLVANIISWSSGHIGVGYNSTIMGSIGLFADAINQASGANIQVAPQYRDLSYTTQDWISKDQSYKMPDTNRSYPNNEKSVNTSSGDGTTTAKEVESDVTQPQNDKGNEQTTEENTENILIGKSTGLKETYRYYTIRLEITKDFKRTCVEDLSTFLDGFTNSNIHPFEKTTPFNTSVKLTFSSESTLWTKNVYYNPTTRKTHDVWDKQISNEKVQVDNFSIYYSVDRSTLRELGLSHSIFFGKSSQVSSYVNRASAINRLKFLNSILSQ